jgi:hypothetical protein
MPVYVMSIGFVMCVMIRSLVRLTYFCCYGAYLIFSLIESVAFIYSYFLCF